MVNFLLRNKNFTKASLKKTNFTAKENISTKQVFTFMKDNGLKILDKGKEKSNGVKKLIASMKANLIMGSGTAKVLILIKTAINMSDNGKKINNTEWARLSMKKEM